VPVDEAQMGLWTAPGGKGKKKEGREEKKGKRIE
jgi:hypothetical protein